MVEDFTEGWSQRAAKVLLHYCILDYEALARYSPGDVLTVPGAGPKTLVEIEGRLAEVGAKLSSAPRSRIPFYECPECGTYGHARAVHICCGKVVELQQLTPEQLHRKMLGIKAREAVERMEDDPPEAVKDLAKE